MVETSIGKKQLVSELFDIRQRIEGIEKLVIVEDYPEQSLDNLFLSLPAATYIVQDGTFIFVSPQMRQITGRSESELIGTSPLSLILDEDRDITRENAVKVLKEEHSLVHEFRIVAKNSRIKWVIQVSSPLSYEGKPAIVANIIDITEQKRKEENERRNGEVYLDLCENATDMIICIMTDGRLKYVNREFRETLGFNEDEIMHMSLFEIMPKDDVHQCLELFQRVISGEKIGNLEATFINKNGYRITVEGTINCRLIEGKPLYIRGIFRDVSDRKRAQAEAAALVKDVQDINRRLETSNRELEDFAHIASHDLQEPLRKINSFGELLQESLKGKLDEDEYENLNFVIDGAKRMQAMIDDLLTYSSITTKAKSLQAVDLNIIIENLKNFELATVLNETKGTIVIPNTLLAAYGDPSQIHQLLQNLIGNGLKFHRDGVSPVITITDYSMQDNMVRFDVTDNGIGINKEYDEQVFVMFKRLHSRQSYKGTGIGLAICKKIIERHGGQIGIKSIPDKGSTFWFTLSRFGESSDKYSRGNGNSE
ncbi:MAG TPA: PAS domain S-box protein [Dehalococcoidia bacterium]|nr:PAS domain S-box protein [Dehalococcoidia bacterium]